MPGNRFVINQYRQDGIFPVPSREPVRQFHRSLDGYAPTELIRRPALAAALGIADLYVKFEGTRFGLQAFKGLGAAWALHKLVADRPGTFTTVSSATDGNHGRAVAWAARKLGLAAVIYMPEHTAKQRQDNIRNEGARVVLVDGTYDEAVALCARESAANGWQVVADIGYDGYLEIPALIVEGYSTLFAEIDEALGAKRPDVVIIPGGVGGVLHAGVDHYRAQSNPPRIVVAEPSEADCLIESAASPGAVPTQSSGSIHSLMACLNAGTVSLTSWPAVRRGTDVFLGLEDEFAAEAMRRLYHAEGGDRSIAVGESGSASTAALIALMEDPRFQPAKEFLRLGPSSTVVVVATEGAIDREVFDRVVGAAR